MNCPQCGQPVQPGAQVCSNCGQVLPQPVTTPPAAMADAAQPTVVAPMPAQAAPLASDGQAGGTYSDPTVSPIPAAPAPQAWPAAPALPTQPEQEGIASPAFASAAVQPVASSPKVLPKIAIIAVAALIVLAGIGIGVWKLLGSKATPAASSQSQGSQGGINTANLTAIDTPCYTVKVTSGLGSYKPSGCTFDTGITGEAFSVVGLTNHTLTAANLAQQGHAEFSATASTLGVPIVSEKSDQFAGSPAYVAVFKTKTNTTIITALVVHQTASGDNVFSVGHTYPTVVTSPTLEPLASTWQWK